MSLQDLYWHYEGVLQQVVIHLAIEDVDCAVVTAARKQRVLLRKLHIPNGLVVVLQILVWLRSHVNIEPDDLLVVGSQDEIVPIGMH